MEKQIFTSIPKIMLEMGAISKDQKVTSGPARFNFRGIDDVYNALQKIMAKHGVFTVPTINSVETKEIESRAGAKGVRAIVNYSFKFYADDSSFIEAQTIGEGIDYGDKAFNKCASIAHKYALLQVFCIPTKEEKDPDFTTHEIVDNCPEQTTAIKNLLSKLTVGMNKEDKIVFLKKELEVNNFNEIKKLDSNEKADVIYMLEGMVKNGKVL